MMAQANSDRPGLDEQYMAATNSSDLTLKPDRVCAATHLIAAGRVDNQVGEALRHLEAEWHAAGKPRKMTEAEIVARAGELPKRNGKPDVKRARTEALVGYAVAMRKRAHQMRGWAKALGLMLQWASMRGVDPDLLSPALYHWLAPTCPVCDGHGVRKMQDAPTLSTKQCYHCNGSGEWPRPLGGQQIKEWLGRCVAQAKRERGHLLHGD